MRLTLKIALVILFGITLLLSLHSYQTVTRETKILKANLSREARLVGLVLRSMAADIWQRQGETAAQSFLKRAGQLVSDQQVRWVWLEGTPPTAQAPRVHGDQLAAARRGETVTIIAETADGRDFLFTYLPLKVPGGHIGAIEIGESLADLHGYVRESMNRSALLLVGMVASSLLLLWVAGSFWVGRPVKRLAEQAERMAGGDFTPGPDLKGHDEIAVLAGALDRMRGQLATAQQSDRERLEALEKLRHTERLATIGRLSAGMAHELGTPLNVIAGRAKLIARGSLPAEEVTRSATIIGEQAERMTAIMRQLLDFARRGTPRKVPVDLRQLMTGILELLGPVAGKQGVTTRLVPPTEPRVVMADGAQLQQVLINLAMNGLQAMPAGGDLEISLEPCGDASPPEAVKDRQGPWTVIAITDNGVGIAPDDLPHLFDPFFTTKEIGQGTGLGLSIAYGIVAEHGGWIDVESRPGQGSRFRVWLPRPAPPREAVDG